MIVYQKDGKDYLLMANSNRGGMKIATEGLDKVESIGAHVRGTAGLKAEKVANLDNAVQLDAFDKDHVVVLRKIKIAAEGAPRFKYDLETVELP
jgi:hypothetical protein